MKNGRFYLIAAILLLVLAVVVRFFPLRRADDLTTSSVDQPKRKTAPVKSGFDEVRQAEGKRAPRDRAWLHAKEVLGEESPEPAESPVFLGFLQSDPSNTKLRIGLRQENGGRIDDSDLAVSVDLLDAQGQNLGEGNAVSTKWETKDGSFQGSPAPILMVDSQEAIAGVSVSLSYKGRQIERRKYTLEER